MEKMIFAGIEYILDMGSRLMRVLIAGPVLLVLSALWFTGLCLDAVIIIYVTNTLA